MTTFFVSFVSLVSQSTNKNLTILVPIKIEKFAANLDINFKIGTSPKKGNFIFGRIASMQLFLSLHERTKAILKDLVLILCS